MPKKIVILMDGTSNQISANRTNILRLYGTLIKNDQQVVYYDPGVGTMAVRSGGMGLLAKFSEVIGMATGKGLDKNVLEAYRFIVEHFRYKAPTKDTSGWQDEIHIVGFSRGAYSARVLAGFLRAFGVMESRNLNLLGYAYRAYRRIESKDSDGDEGASWDEIKLYARTLRPFQPQIRFLGIYDTVSSVIVFGRYFWRFGSHAFTNANNSIQNVRHAVAIHERRIMFRPNLWQKGQEYCPDKDAEPQPQNQREVWFTGVHTDIGGGEIEPESGLAKISLAWFIEQAQRAEIGLLFDADLVDLLVLGKKTGGSKTYTAPNPLAEKHKMLGLWKILEILPTYDPKAPRRFLIGKYRPHLSKMRPIPEGAHIHASVFERAKHKGDLPPNLPADHSLEP